LLQCSIVFGLSLKRLPPLILHAINLASRTHPTSHTLRHTKRGRTNSFRKTRLSDVHQPLAAKDIFFSTRHLCGFLQRTRAKLSSASPCNTFTSRAP
jgi:hypothetical protein